MDHSLGNGYAIALLCPRSRQDRQLLLHLLASPTGESLSCALPWAASEYKPHATRTIPTGGVQVQPLMLLHQGPSQAQAARIQMGAGIWGCAAKHEDSQASSALWSWWPRMDAQRKNGKRKRVSKGVGHGLLSDRSSRAGSWGSKLGHTHHGSQGVWGILQPGQPWQSC